jgi:hypothetical protein
VFIEMVIDHSNAPGIRVELIPAAVVSPNCDIPGKEWINTKESFFFQKLFGYSIYPFISSYFKKVDS